jgi:hypothetical protein
VAFIFHSDSHFIKNMVKIPSGIFREAAIFLFIELCLDHLDILLKNNIKSQSHHYNRDMAC